MEDSRNFFRSRTVRLAPITAIGLFVLVAVWAAYWAGTGFDWNRVNPFDVKTGDPSPALGEASTGVAVSGSMEPSVPAPIRFADCPKCRLRFGFSEASIRDEFPVHCRRCNARIAWERHVESPQPVALRPLEESHSVQVGDIVAFRTDPQEPLEIKRILGLDQQLVELKEGDLWIDGRRFQKDMAPFLKQSLLVEAFEMSADQPFSKVQHIGRDYWMNHGERVARRPIRDFGVVIPDWQRSSSGSYRIAIDVEERSIELRVEKGIDDSMRCSVLADGKARLSCELDVRDAWWIAIACVDGRWMLGSPDSQHEFSIDPSNRPSTYESRHRDPLNSPLASSRIEDDGEFELRIEWSGFEEGTKEAWIIRDLYYESPGQESTRFEASSGWIVVGDNLSISHDSRQRHGDRVPRSAIRYGMIEPTDPLSNLRRQRRLLRSNVAPGS